MVDPRLKLHDALDAGHRSNMGKALSGAGFARPDRPAE